MAVKRALVQDNVIYRRAGTKKSMAVIVTAAQGDAPAAPAIVGSATGGTLVAATYVYRSTYVVNGIESAPSAASVGYVAGGTTSSVQITASGPPAGGMSTNAVVTQYKIYGRTGGTFLLIATLTAPTTVFVDTGSVTPAGAITVQDFGISFRSPYSGHTLFTGVLPGRGPNQYQRI